MITVDGLRSALCVDATEASEADRRIDATLAKMERELSEIRDMIRELLRHVAPAGNC